MCERSGASLEAIDDADNMDDFAAEFLDAIDSEQCTAAGGNDVVNDDDVLSGLYGAFDESLGAVPFGLFSDHKAEELSLLCGGGHEDSADDRIRPDAHATEPGEFNIFEEFEESPGDLEESFGAEGDLFAIEVVGGFFSGCECEVAKLEGSLADEIHEAVAVEHRDLEVRSEK